jgi:hypothetical protein
VYGPEHIFSTIRQLSTDSRISGGFLTIRRIHGLSMPIRGLSVVLPLRNCQNPLRYGLIRGSPQIQVVLPRISVCAAYSFDISGCLDMEISYESKIESDNSWEYNSLHLSPDVTRTADPVFEEFDT